VQDKDNYYEMTFTLTTVNKNKLGLEIHCFITVSEWLQKVI